MKILVAVIGSRPKVLKGNTLRWASRAGFTFKVFITDEDNIDDFHDAIDEANHDYYLDVRFTTVINKLTPEQFAKENGYELVLYLPEDLPRWKKGDSEDGTVLHFASDLGKARLAFSQDPNKKTRKFVNKAIMVRL